jgi:hypothetical protein
MQRIEYLLSSIPAAPVDGNYIIETAYLNTIRISLDRYIVIGVLHGSRVISSLWRGPMILEAAILLLSYVIRLATPPKN